MPKSKTGLKMNKSGQEDEEYGHLRQSTCVQETSSENIWQTVRKTHN